MAGQGMNASHVVNDNFVIPTLCSFDCSCFGTTCDGRGAHTVRPLIHLQRSCHHNRHAFVCYMRIKDDYRWFMSAESGYVADVSKRVRGAHLNADLNPSIPYSNREAVADSSAIWDGRGFALRSGCRRTLMLKISFSRDDPG